jgi:hypothetical protein
VNCPAGAQKSLNFKNCTTRELVFIGKCWQVFWPENSSAPFSGGVSDVGPTNILGTQNPVGPRFLRVRKTWKNPVGPLFLKSRKREAFFSNQENGRQNPVWFLKFWFLIAGIPLYRGTSLIRKRLPLGPYSRPVPMGLWRY